MVLVVGGLASGKRTFVKKLGYEERDMADGVLDVRPVVFNVQDILALRLTTTADTKRAIAHEDDLVNALARKDVIIMEEMGSGVVPNDPQERALRDAMGHLSVQLALRADTVVRMVCGIPCVLKGHLGENSSEKNSEDSSCNS